MPIDPVDVFIPLIAPLFAALTARWLAERLPPRTATWLLTVVASALALITGVTLGLLALAAVIRIPFIAAVGHLSLRVMTRDDPAALPLGLVAGVLLAIAGAAAVAAAWRRGGALIAAHRHAHGLPGTGQVVVVADEAADAYAVPGRPCRIVITSGMMRALSAPERQVLLAHERAHATGRHYLFMTVARLASAANPLLRPVAATIGYSVERWADEQAATAAGDRRLAARTIARAALAAAAGPPRQDTPASSLGAVPGVAELSGAGVVPRRVAALLRPAPQPRLILLAMVVALVVVCGLLVLDAAIDLHGLIELAQTAAG
ncbi:MAG TPA: M56 family metallopeptidase [Streptosporangiaceae bacterium]|jgi:Zn-dependent protease with chaperone function